MMSLSHPRSLDVYPMRPLMFERLTALIKRVIKLVVPDELDELEPELGAQVPEASAVALFSQDQAQDRSGAEPTRAFHKTARTAREDLDEDYDPSPMELLEEHVVSLENTELLLQQALTDPLQFLKDYQDEEFFKLAEDDPLVLTAPLPEVKYHRSPQANSSLVARVAEPRSSERGAEPKGELSGDGSPHSSRVIARTPRAEKPKIKVPKSKKKKGSKSSKSKKKSGPKESVYVKHTGDSFTQRAEVQSESLKNPLEYAYLLPYETVRERSRPPSRYDHMNQHHSFSASVRAAAMQSVVDSLDELIVIHVEAIKRREAFFESIQSLLDSKQLHLTEADAWWYHYNRATSYLEEQRILKRASYSPSVSGQRRSAQASTASRSPRRELNRLQASLELAQATQERVAQVQAPAELSPAQEERSAASRPQPVQVAQMSAQPELEATQATQAEQTQRPKALQPATPKPHRKKGSGRLFSSALPRHELTLGDMPSRDEGSIGLAPTTAPGPIKSEP